MKTKSPIRLVRFGSCRLAIALAALLAAHSANATSATWSGATDATWATLTNWSANPVPGSDDTATFDNAGGTLDTIDLGVSGVTINTIVFDTASAAAYTIGSGAVGSQTLTLASGGALTMNATVANIETFNANIVLGTDGTEQNFSLTNNTTGASAKLMVFNGAFTGSAGSGLKTLTVNANGSSASNNFSLMGNISNGTSGTVKLVKEGAGIMTLGKSGSTMSYTGGTYLNAGTLQIVGIAANLQSGTSLYIAGGTNLNCINQGAGTYTNIVQQWNGDFSFNDSTRYAGSSLQNMTFTGGTVDLGASGTAAARTVTVAANTLTIGGVISNGTNLTTTGLTKAGAGTMVLSGSNDYTGTTTLSAGTLQANHASALGIGGDITFAGGLLQYTAASAGQDWATRFKNSTVAAIRLDTNSQNVTLAGMIDSSNTGGLTKSGSGTLTLSNSSNSYSGNTVIGGGTLRLGANDAISAASALRILDGGSGGSGSPVLNLDGFSTTVASIYIHGQDSGQYGTITNTGTGMLTTMGTIQLDTYNNHQSDITGLLSLGGGVRNLTATGYVNNKISAVISNGGLNVTAGMVSLYGANTYAGGTTLAGTINVAVDSVYSGTFPSGSITSSAIGTGNLVFNGGGLSSNGATARTIYNPVSFTGNAALCANGSGKLTFVADANLGGATRTLTVSNVAQFDGIVSNGSITKEGAGTLIFTNTSNALTGTVSVTQGTLQAGGNNVFTSGINLTVGGGASAPVFALNNYDQTVGNLTLSANASTAPQVTTGTGVLTVTGSIAASLFNSSTASISGNLNLGGGTRSVTGGQASTSWTIAAAISNGGLNIVSTGGFLALTGQNTYASNTTLTGGTLRLGSAENAGVSGPLGNPTTPAGSIIFSGGTLQWSAANQYDYSARFGVANNSAYNFDTNGQSVTLGTALPTSGTNNLTKAGTGTLTLSVANSYTGVTTVTGGILQVPNAATLPNYNLSAKVVINVGTLGVNLGGGSDWTTSQMDTLLANATKTSGALGIDTTNASGGLTQWTAFTTTNLGALGLTKLGSNTLTLNQSNTYTGTTTVNGGTLVLAGGNHTLAVNKALVVNTGGTLDLGPNRQYVGQFSGTGGSIAGSGILTTYLTVAGSYAGAIGGSVNLIKVGAQTLTLTGANNTTGTASVIGGGLILSGSGVLSANTGITLNKAALTLDNSGTNINGRVNAAALSLDSGTVTYTGGTGTAATESFGAVTADAGLSYITATPGSGTASAVLTLNSLTRASGAMLAVSGTNLGTSTNPYGRILVTTALGGTLAPVNGIVPGVVIANSNALVGYVSGLGFGAAGTAGGFPVMSSKALNAALSTDNVSTTAGAVKVGGQTVNAIIQNNAITFSSDSDVLTVASGMITQGGESGKTIGSETVGQRGQLTSGIGELFYVKVNGGSGGGLGLNKINSVITDNGGTRVKFVIADYQRPDLTNQNPNLTANNTYTGGTVMSGGNVLYLTATTAGWTTIPAANDPTQGLVIDNSTVTMQTNAQQIAASNIVTLNGGSTLNLVGANNTLAGIVFNSNGGTATPTVTGGTKMTITGNVSSTPTNVAVTPLISNTTLDLNGTATHDITVSALPDGNYVNGATLNGLAISSVISNGGFTKKGTGVLNLTGASTFAGQLTVEEGVLNVATVNNISANGVLGNSASAVMLGGSGGKTGTLEYTGGNATSSKPFTLATGGSGAFQIDAAATELTLSGQIDGSGGLVKTGAGTVTLSTAKSYSGDTTVKAGTLKLGASGSIAYSPKITVGDAGSSGSVLDVAGVTGGFSIGGTQALMGIGKVNGAVTISDGGIHTAGDAVTVANTSGAGTIGNQAFSTGITYNQGSILEWNLTANTESTIGTRGINYDAVNTAALATSGSGAIFRVVLNGSQNFSESFWEADRTWTDIFTNVAGTTSLDIATIFSSVQTYNASGSTTPAVGSFAISGSSLTWTYSAVPEVSNLLTGLLLGAGLLRRRR
jgi:autotransporter-associated beta strand protein